MVPAEKRFECIDEQTNINSLSIELCCKKMTANYKRTAQHLDALLEDSKGAVIPTLGDKILINTSDDKRLAVAIVQEVKHYFGEPKNKPKNTADEALIINMADGWLEGIKRSTAKTMQRECIDLVVEKTRQKFTVDDKSRANGEFTKSFDEIIKAVEQWAEAKRKEKKAEPEPNEPGTKHDYFRSRLNEYNAMDLFKELYNKKYINGELSDWLIYCGVKKGTPIKRIDWLQGVNELAYFVGELFGETNRCKWAIATKVFLIGGADIKRNCLRTSYYDLAKISKDKRDALDEIIYKVSHKKASVINDLSNI